MKVYSRYLRVQEIRQKKADKLWKALFKLIRSNDYDDSHFDAFKCLVNSFLNITSDYSDNLLFNKLLLKNLPTRYLEFLLDHPKVNITFKDNCYHGHLQCAATQETSDYLRLLISKRDINLDYVDYYGRTALGYAISTRKVECIKFLISQNGVKIENHHIEGIVRVGNLELIQKWIDKGYWQLNDQDKTGQTVLHYAVISGNLEIVEYLIKSGINRDSKDYEGQTALHYAALSKESSEMITLLCQKEVNTNIKDNRGMTPLYYLINDLDKQLNIYWKTGQKGDKSTSKIQQLIIRCCDNITTLVSHNARLDITDYDGKTLLHHAVGHNIPEDMIYLLNSAYNSSDISTIPAFLLKTVDNSTNYINMQDNNGDTALHIAVRTGHKSFVRLLCEKGANADIKNKEDKVPLDIAISLFKKGDIKYPKILKILTSSTSNDMITESLEKIQSKNSQDLQNLIESYMQKSLKSAQIPTDSVKPQEGEVEGRKEKEKSLPISLRQESPQDQNWPLTPTLPVPAFSPNNLGDIPEDFYEDIPYFHQLGYIPKDYCHTDNIKLLG